jgi:hypothetical protein
MRAVEFGDEFVDARLVGRDVVDGDLVAFLGQAADDGFTSGEMTWLVVLRQCLRAVVGDLHAAGGARDDGCSFGHLGR